LDLNVDRSCVQIHSLTSIGGFKNCTWVSSSAKSKMEFYFILTWHIHSYNCANKHFLLCVMLDSCYTLCLRTTRHCVTWDKFLCINNIRHIFGQGYCV
jgi:hypothetical protein